jgi:catechol 2,3-dioxygenase-like lactoylglutathione lyase family enzyme
MPHVFTHDHVGLSLTPDHLDVTVEWYTSKLGFTVDQRFVVHGTTFVFLASKNIKIELLAAASHRQETTVENIFASLDRERLHHFCMAVEDLDATLSWLGERDVHSVGEPMDVHEIGQRIAFITDNLGNIIELTAPGTRPAPAQR